MSIEQMVNLQEILAGKALVVERSESLDPHDRMTISYSITLLLLDKDEEPTGSTMTLDTDEKDKADKFKIGMCTDLKFLESEIKQMQKSRKVRAN